MELLRTAWQRLQWHPNADIDFYLTVLASRPEILRPHVIALGSNGDVKAMLIGRIEERALDFKVGYKTVLRPKARVLTIIYGGILGDASPGVCRILIKILMEALNKGEADMIAFSHVDINSPLLSFGKTLPNFLQRDYAIGVNAHLKINLTGTMEDFLRRVERNTRRICRKFEREEQVQVKCFSSVEDVKILCNDIEQIAKTTYHRGLGVGFVYNNENENILVLSAINGWLRGYVLYVGGRPCSFWLATLYKKTAHTGFTGYLPEYQHYKPGALLFLKMIEDFYRMPNLESVDLGFGDALYKRQYCDHSWEEVSFYIYSRSFRGLRLNIGRTVVGFIDLNLRRFVKNLKLEAKIKKIWRLSKAGKD